MASRGVKGSAPQTESVNSHIFTPPFNKTAKKRTPVQIAFVVILMAVGCSHEKPYIRPDVQQFKETCICGKPCATDDNVKHRILLIGDTGDPSIGDAELEESIVSDETLKSLCPKAPQGTLKGKTNPYACKTEPALVSLYLQAKQIPKKTTIIFLGDNIYPAGLPEKDPEEAVQILEAQLLVARQSGARTIFVPGNHDWDEARQHGNKAVMRLIKHFGTLSLSNIYFAPQNGCPGPVKVDCDGVRIIVLDTQWWLHKYDKEVDSCVSSKVEEGIEFDSCNGGEIVEEKSLDPGQEEGLTGVDENLVKDKFIGKLKNYLNTDGKEVIVAAHHPIATHGPHGGFFDWKGYLFAGRRIKKWLWIPLPPLYPLVRWHLARDDQDLIGPRNKELVGELKEAFSSVGEKKPLIYAAGHEHSLQVLDGGDAAKYVLVSGAGSNSKVKKSAVTDGKDTLFAHLHSGFMQVDFMKDEKVFLHVVEPKEGSLECEFVFSMRLK